MNTHVNITNNGTDREPADLSRRSFLVDPPPLVSRSAIPPSPASPAPTRRSPQPAISIPASGIRSRRTALSR